MTIFRYGEYFGFSVSHTTRQPRPGKDLKLDLISQIKLQIIIIFSLPQGSRMERITIMSQGKGSPTEISAEGIWALPK